MSSIALNSYSTNVKKAIKTALDDAREFESSGIAKERDADALTFMSERQDGYLLPLSSSLRSSANFHGRISFGHFLGSEKYSVNLADCWNLICLAAKFREQSSVKSAQKVGGAKGLFEEKPIRCLPVEIHQLAFATWGLYLLGDKVINKEMSHFFELFDLRGDITDSASDDELSAYDLTVCVSLLIGRQDPSFERIESLLGNLPIFSELTEFWSDDKKFSDFTERAAQWHIDYSLQHLGTFSRFASSPHEILFPTWIFALDKFRQDHYGCPSSIGKHELLTLGRDFVHSIQAQSNPQLPILRVANEHYIERFGIEQFNPVPFWESFLKT